MICKFFTSLIAAILLTCPILACDVPKGMGIPVTITIQPGTTHTEFWDYSNCQSGIRNVSFYLNYKAGAKPEARLFDLTTNVEYAPNTRGTVFYLINGGETMAGHVLALTIANGGKKPITVSVQLSACLCN